MAWAASWLCHAALLCLVTFGSASSADAGEQCGAEAQPSEIALASELMQRQAKASIAEIVKDLEAVGAIDQDKELKSAEGQIAKIVNILKDDLEHTKDQLDTQVKNLHTAAKVEVQAEESPASVPTPAPTPPPPQLAAHGDEADSSASVPTPAPTPAPPSPQTPPAEQASADSKFVPTPAPTPAPTSQQMPPTAKVVNESNASLSMVQQFQRWVVSIQPPTVPWHAAMLPGLTYGMLLVVGPDHLGTAMTLSVTASSPQHAFRAGASWSLGHSTGMCMVAVLILCLKKMVSIDLEAWEHVGDYVIGSSMLLCGLFFLFREQAYLQENDDGTVSLKACDCHGHGHSNAELQDPCQATCHGPEKRAPCLLPASSFAPTLANQMAYRREVAAAPQKMEQTWYKELQGATIGILQGMCCPMGLVGVAFLASLPPVGVVVFIATFLLVAAVGIGAVSSLWLLLVSNTLLNSGISSRTLYRMSCGFTMLLGAVWIVANFYGVLDKLNYAEGAEMAPRPQGADMAW